MCVYDELFTLNLTNYLGLNPNYSLSTCLTTQLNIYLFLIFFGNCKSEIS